MGVDRARWLLRTSNPLCLVTSGVGGFDSLALPPDNFKHEITWFQPKGKPPTVMVGGFVFDQMVTNFFAAKFVVPNVRVEPSRVTLWFFEFCVACISLSCHVPESPFS